MTSPICVDSSMVLAIVLGEAGRDRVESKFAEWIDEGLDVIAPSLFAYEITSVIRTKTHRKLITREEGLTALRRAFDLHIALQRPDQLHERAWRLAERLNRPAAYDAHYLALAEMLGCDFWTADERLFNSVSAQVPWVHWVGR